MPFLILFIVLPILELTVMIKVGTAIGALSTLGLILLTAIVGMVLIRAQGLMTLLRAREKLAEGTLPARELAEGFLLAFAGALLIVPGFITDAMGALLLLPPLRKALAGAALKALQMKGTVTMYQSHSVGGERDVFDATDNRITRQPGQRQPPADVIDGEYRRED